MATNKANFFGAPACMSVAICYERNHQDFWYRLPSHDKTRPLMVVVVSM